MKMLVKIGVANEMEQCLENLMAVLKNAGSITEKNVRVAVYLTSADDLGGMNEVYEEYFPRDAPARASVEVSKLALGARVEVNLTARLK